MQTGAAGHVDEERSPENVHRDQETDAGLGSGGKQLVHPTLSEGQNDYRKDGMLAENVLKYRASQAGDNKDHLGGKDTFDLARPWAKTLDIDHWEGAQAKRCQSPYNLRR